MSEPVDAVPVVLDGTRRELRVTLGAARKINREFDGFLKAFSRLAAYDFEAFVFVVAAGLEANDGAALAEVEQAVFATGLSGLMAPLGAYLRALSEGGQPAAIQPEGDAAGKA